MGKAIAIVLFVLGCGMAAYASVSYLLKGDSAEKVAGVIMLGSIALGIGLFIARTRK